jgi:diguanylate cyclase (GGDEF)-like protein
VYGHIGAALSGESRSFEAEAELRGRHYHHRTSFVPDRAADGSIKGFFSLTLDVTAQKHAERELERLARFDPLTGLANRRHFDESLRDAVARAQRAGAALVLLALDIDRFKQINDSLGHAAGDEVLKVVAGRIRDCIYEVDLPARLGGDEFVVLIEYSPDAEVGAMVAQRIVDSMHAPIALAETTLSVSASIGVGMHFPVRAADVLLELADQALYDAKRAGRDTWRLRQG